MKADWLCFDIETRATTDHAIIEQITKRAIDARPAHNTPREIKAAWDTPAGQKERINDAIAKTSLDPLLLEPLCICASSTEGEILVLDGMENPKSKMISNMRDLIGDLCDRDTLFVGHNLEGFDMLIILAQFQKLRIPPPDVFPKYHRGRWRGNIWDTMSACPGRTPFTSLVDAALAYGTTAKAMLWKGEPMTGARVADAFREGEYELIRKYCAQDVRDETALFLVQTSGGTYGIASRTDAAAAQLAEISESALTPAQKWLATVPILQSYGLLK